MLGPPALGQLGFSRPGPVVQAGLGPVFSGPVGLRPAAFLGGPSHGRFGSVAVPASVAPARFQNAPAVFDGPVPVRVHYGGPAIVPGHTRLLGAALASHHVSNTPVIVGGAPAHVKVHALPHARDGLAFSGAAGFVPGHHPHHAPHILKKAR